MVDRSKLTDRISICDKYVNNIFPVTMPVWMLFFLFICPIIFLCQSEIISCKISKGHVRECM